MNHQLNWCHIPIPLLIDGQCQVDCTWSHSLQDHMISHESLLLQVLTNLGCVQIRCPQAHDLQNRLIIDGPLEPDSL